MFNQGLRLLFLTNVPEATSIPESRVILSSNIFRIHEKETSFTSVTFLFLFGSISSVASLFSVGSSL